jgi:lipoprotein-anchoring transpeptidase ErfK/SrfK
VFGVRRPVQQPGGEASAGGNAADLAGADAAAPGRSERAPGGEGGPSGGEGGPSGSEGGRSGSEGAPSGSAGGPPGASPSRLLGRPGPKGVAVVAAAALAISAGIAYAVTSQTASSNGSTASPIRVVSISPANQTAGVDGADPVIVTFSRPVSPRSATPTLTPSVPGSWTVFGDSMEFVPTTPFNQSTTVTVQIPGGSSGVHSSGGGHLTAAVTSQFTTAAYSQAGLAVLLAEQGYLPMTFAPDRTSPAVAGLWGADAAADTPAGEAYQPPPGAFSWDSGYPSTLQADWTPDQANVILQGAVMAFKSEHNMTIDGSLTPQLWTALFQAQQRGEQNANGYTYAIANKGSPETLTIWHNGQQVLQSPANTGIAVAPTVDGTFPVYERFLNTIMSGTNPDGSHYSDPVSFVSYFNGGDAVHYFPRGSYGYPQSLGCVELPYNEAEQAYPYLTYGSLVSVQG